MADVDAIAPKNIRSPLPHVMLLMLTPVEKLCLLSIVIKITNAIPTPNAIKPPTDGLNDFFSSLINIGIDATINPINNELTTYTLLSNE